MPRGTGARILIVEDEKSSARLIERKLRRHRFALQTFTTASEALLAFDRLRPDLVLVDMDLGDMSGSSLISDIRSRASVPIVVISGASKERDAVTAFELGADDYIVKPFGLDELVARIRVALRHVARPTAGVSPVIRIGSVELDIEQRRVTRAGRAIHLTPKEYQLLKFFATHPDRFVPDRTLLNEVWGSSWRGGEHILHVYVARLRKKVEDNPAAPRYLLTESGLGYRFVVADGGTGRVQVSGE